MSNIKVAIVILNWNGQKLLERFLPSVIRYSSLPGVEIIVADNASEDKSVDFLSKNYEGIRVIELSENLGYAEGYNQALAQIDAEYFVLLNSDVEVTEGWLKPMIDYLDANADIAAVQPKLLGQRQKTHFEYAGAAGGYIDKLGFPFCRGRIFDTVEHDHGQYNTIQDIFWASGACMLVRSKDFFEVGAFDGKFFAHMEEIDLCWRFRARGKRIVCLPLSVVFHVGGATLDEESAHKVYLNFRNNMLMLFKNLENSLLERTIRRRVMYNTIAALKFYFTGNRAKAKAIFKAHKDFKAMRKEYIDVRQENIEKTTVSQINEIYIGNITLDYFLKGKKEFSKLFFMGETN